VVSHRSSGIGGRSSVIGYPAKTLACNLIEPVRKLRLHIISLFLGCLVLLPLVFSGGLQLFQVYLKYRAEHRLETEVLQTLSVPEHKVQWVEEGRELMVNGRMFDLKSYSVKNGILTAWGIFDEEETQAMALLNHFNDKQQDLLIIRLLWFTQCLVVLGALLIAILPPPALQRKFWTYYSSYTHHFSNPPDRPPRVTFLPI
jgi:hypothetical protein